MVSPAFVSSGLSTQVAFRVGRVSSTSARSNALRVCRQQSRRSSVVKMVSPEVARSAIAVYGVFIAGGGIGAFVKSASKPSLISGVAAGIVLAFAYFKDSLPVALAAAVALAIVFSIRLAKTKKFMPAGMLGLVSLIAAVFFAYAIYV